ncbi:MAG: nuclear transport factor 2 family protein [Chloroflexi bacterium]|nr:nuclear transport factor 2 family protein [Chloroflexota bacterium]
MRSRTTLFADIDTMVPEAFARHLAEDVTMRFGNAPPMHGRAACREAWAGFCELVDGVHHEVVNQWDVGDTTIAETAVTYTRKNGARVTVPVVTIYRAGGELIAEYRVFLDLTPVFANEPPA